MPIDTTLHGIFSSDSRKGLLAPFSGDFCLFLFGRYIVPHGMFERHSFFHRDLCQACVHVSCLAEAALLPQLTPLSSYGPLVPNAPVTNSPSHVTAVSHLLGYGANHVSLEVSGQCPHAII